MHRENLYGDFIDPITEYYKFRFINQNQIGFTKKTSKGIAFQLLDNEKNPEKTKDDKTIVWLITGGNIDSFFGRKLPSQLERLEIFLGLSKNK